MKRILWIITSLILFSTAGNCQWYQRIYGVNDPGELSYEQLKEAYGWTSNKMKTGKIMSAVGAVGIAGGVAEILATENVGEGFGILFGVAAIIMCIPVELTGLIIWGVNGSRLDVIEMNLARSKISLGLNNGLPVKSFVYPDAVPLPGLVLVISF